MRGAAGEREFGVLERDEAFEVAIWRSGRVVQGKVGWLRMERRRGGRSQVGERAGDYVRSMAERKRRTHRTRQGQKKEDEDERLRHRRQNIALRYCCTRVLRVVGHVPLRTQQRDSLSLRSVDASRVLVSCLERV